MPELIRVILVDDHVLFRDSLGRLLQAEQACRVVGSFSSIPEALETIARELVDVVLLDYDLDGQNGLSFFDAAQSIGFRGRVLMVTAGMSEADTLRAFERGAAGIFLKHSAPAQLLEAIRTIADGEMWLDPKTVRAVVSLTNRTTVDRSGLNDLNPRERSVLKSVFEGLSNKEIATRLDISETTVKWVMQRLFEKTGVRTRSQLVRIALEKHAHDWLG